MSEPFASTDEKRDAVCDKCGASVHEVKMAGLYGSSIWDLERHDAPCGLPCFGAGVPGKAYRLGEFHGDPKHCPRCLSGSSARTERRS